MNKRQLLAKRVGLVALTSLLMELNSIVMLPILTKNLPVSEYGIWIQISVTIGLITAIALLGLPYTMVRFLPSVKGRENISEMFYSLAIMVSLAGFAASNAIFFLAEPIAAALFEGQQIVVKILSILVFIECLISIPFAYFRAVQEIKKYSVFNLSKAFLNLLFVICFILSGKGIIGALTGLLLADVMIFLAMASIIVSKIGISPPKLKNIRQYLAFGLPTIPGNLSGWIISSSNRYVIGLLMGTTFVAYFSPGYTLGNFISLLIVPVSFILPAVLSKHYDEGDQEEVRTILGSSLKFFLILGIPAAFGVSILSRPILIVLSTPEIADQGYMVTPFMAIGALFYGSYSIVSQILVLEKNTALIGKIWIIVAILNLVSSIILIAIAGIIGGAVANMLAFAIVFIIANHYAKRSIKIPLKWNFILKSLASSMVMSSLLLVLRPEGVAELSLSIAFGAMIYFIFLFLLKGFTKDEVEFIKVLRNNK